MANKINAAVGIAKCQHTNKIYGVRVEEKGKDKWWATWTFPIKPEVATREGYSEQPFPADIQYEKNYPGCPYCQQFEDLKTGSISNGQKADVYLAVDLSGSMGGNPLSEAKKAMIDFVAQMNAKQIRIGIIAFATGKSHVLELTDNYENVKRKINALTVGYDGIGGGNASEPFTLARPILEKNEGMKYILVLTDGEWCDLDERWAISEAKKCHKSKIEVIALGFGGVKKSFLDAIASSKEFSKLTTLNNLSDAFTGFAKDIGAGRK
ncbi:MAG: VWA domain-containing protein [Firmicutes bacterium]|nr:VWA domain-containing protein [Bacillota bacterium]